MKTQIIKTIQELQQIQLNWDKKTVGFVPTMGALHDGHLSLLQKSISENEITVCSIFVNPTQFNNSEDLEKYPRTLDADLKLLNSISVDYLFIPSYESMYPDSYKYKISENNFSKILCGKYREGHFDGVLTIVMKLLNLIQPTNAYFGKKDFQQFYLIKEMTEAFFMKVKIVGVETKRDSEGLALSSRNIRLSEAGMKKARAFAKILNSQKTPREIKNQLEEYEIQVEYIEEHMNRKFAAVWIDNVRLIDNV